MRRLWMVVVVGASCGDASLLIARPDATVAMDAKPLAKDSSIDASTPPRCGLASLLENQVPVIGDFHSSKFDGVVCDNGIGTYFLGPGQATPKVFSQLFSTTSSASGTVGSNFQFTSPAEVYSASFNASLDVSTPVVGPYRSDTQCGWIRFEVRLPIPPGVACPTRFTPCDPGCEGYGEMAVCQPGHPRLSYVARTAAPCAVGQEMGIGSWSLTISSVVPQVIPETSINYLTHGQLSAILVNEADPKDTVTFELTF